MAGEGYDQARLIATIVIGCWTNFYDTSALQASKKLQKQCIVSGVSGVTETSAPPIEARLSTKLELMIRKEVVVVYIAPPESATPPSNLQTLVNQESTSERWVIWGSPRSATWSR